MSKELSFKQINSAGEEIIRINISDYNKLTRSEKGYVLDTISDWCIKEIKQLTDE